MFKKILGYSLIALAFFSCSKNDGVVNQPKKKGNLEKATTILPLSSTPGEFHNAILDEFDSRWGIVIKDTPTTTTVTEVIENFERVAQIAQDNGDFISTADVHDYAVQEVNNMISAGYFTSTGNLKGNQTLNDLIAGRVTNSSIKSALLDINSFSGSDQDFLSYVHAHLAALTGLTTSEENMLDGYESVIGSSFTYWAAKGNPLTKLEAFNRAVAIADALGFVEGWNAAVDLGYWYLAEPYAKYHAASVSITAAKNFSWE